MLATIKIAGFFALLMLTPGFAVEDTCRDCVNEAYPPTGEDAHKMTGTVGSDQPYSCARAEAGHPNGCNEEAGTYHYGLCDAHPPCGNSNLLTREAGRVDGDRITSVKHFYNEYSKNVQVDSENNRLLVVDCTGVIIAKVEVTAGVMSALTAL